jgi:hypothetical protein
VLTEADREPSRLQIRPRAQGEQHDQASHCDALHQHH